MDTQQESTDTAQKSQFILMKKRRFAPFFWTQFLGAFNDNVFKNALIILIAFQAAQSMGVDSNVLTNLAAGLFILPFFLLSAVAGQISDKYEKSNLIRLIKLMEIIIMMCAAAAFYFKNVIMLLILLFFMGGQSAFFGPVKYSIIPQHLKPDELVGGNALVSMGTFVSILLGTITGGILIQIENGSIWLGIILCLLAVAGWLAGRKIPEAPALSPNIKINLNLFSQIWTTIGYARRIHSVFLSILAISWFWFLGSAYLTQIPNFTKLILKGNETVVTLLLSMFSIGIGVGSLLCERLSGHKIELGLVPLGSIGLSIFGMDLFLAYDTPQTTELMGIMAFFGTNGSLRVLCDLFFIGIFGGFYIVPLNAFIQMRTEPEYRARVIAANNILNAMFMVLSTISGIIILSVMELNIMQFFLIVTIANILVALYIYSVVPEFTMRFLIWILTHTMYRVHHQGLEKIPDEGAVVMVCNHVSYVDGLIIAGACRRPIRFVMLNAIFKMPLISFICRTGKAIPITSRNKNAEVYEQAFNKIAEALDEGEPVCIFPEGKLTKDGEIDIFKSGIEKIIERNPVPVIPMALKGLWGSFFSNKDGAAFSRRPSRFWSKVELVAGDPVMPKDVSAEKLREFVTSLRGETR